MDNQTTPGNPITPEETATKPTSVKKILVIEDEQFLRQLISRKLSSEGYTVVEALDGEDGLIKIKTERPDLVLLDLILPGINGFTVLSKVKNDPEISNIPIIILSNLGQDDDIDKGRKLGAVDYLIKTRFTPAEIIQKIKKFLDQPEPQVPTLSQQ
ncbi:MAG: response regulator [Patescibacteria group bacterium]|nr:response regulator [Patescibacteria group bacterium]